jgi:hypothetical protein
MSGFWLRIDPAGCVDGSVREDAVGQLAEDAHKVFTPRVVDRRREAAAGWRVELVDRARFDAIRPCLYGRCEHGRATA